MVWRYFSNWFNKKNICNICSKIYKEIRKKPPPLHKAEKTLKIKAFSGKEGLLNLPQKFPQKYKRDCRKEKQYENIMDQNGCE